MDLALEMGMTVRELEHRMTERELSLWAIYRAKRELPTRRIEHYLAQITYAIARSAGSKVKSHTEFLLIPDEPVEEMIETATAEEHVEALRALIGDTKRRARIYASRPKNRSV